MPANIDRAFLEVISVENTSSEGRFFRVLGVMTSRIPYLHIITHITARTREKQIKMPRGAYSCGSMFFS